MHIQSCASPKPKGFSTARSKLILPEQIWFRLTTEDLISSQLNVRRSLSKYYTRGNVILARETACGGWGKFRARRRLAKSRPQIRTLRPAANRHARMYVALLEVMHPLCTTCVALTQALMCVACCSAMHTHIGRAHDGAISSLHARAASHSRSRHTRYKIHEINTQARLTLPPAKHKYINIPLVIMQLIL